MKRPFRIITLLCVLAALSGSIYAAPKQASLRFMWWGGESRHKATIAAIELYMKQNPNVKISGEYVGFAGYQQKLLTQLAGDTAADIIQIDQPWVADLMSQGDLFVNLYKTKDIKLSGFDKKFLKNQCEWEGKLIGLPTGLNGLIYIANADFLAKHQISTNTKWDWDKLLEVGTKVHQDNKDHYLLALDLPHIEYTIKMYVAQHKGNRQWVNDDFTPGFDKEVLTQAFTYYRKLIQSGTIPPLEETILFKEKIETIPKWGAGEIGIIQNWVSIIPSLYYDGKIKLNAMLLPVKPGAKITGIIVRPSQLLVINRKSSNIKEAAKFVNWFFNDPEALLILKTERGIPPTKAGLKVLEENNLLDSNMVKGISLAVKNAGYPENALSTNRELLAILDEYIQEVGFGRLSPGEAADRMLKEFQTKLAELKTQK